MNIYIENYSKSSHGSGRSLLAMTPVIILRGHALAVSTQKRLDFRACRHAGAAAEPAALDAGDGGAEAHGLDFALCLPPAPAQSRRAKRRRRRAYRPRAYGTPATGKAFRRAERRCRPARCSPRGKRRWFRAMRASPRRDRPCPSSRAGIRRKKSRATPGGTADRPSNVGRSPSSTTAQAAPPRRFADRPDESRIAVIGEHDVGADATRLPHRPAPIAAMTLRRDRSRSCGRRAH